TVSVHVRANDVHLIRPSFADLRAVDLFAWSWRVPLRVDAAQCGVGLQLWVRVHTRTRREAFGRIPSPTSTAASGATSRSLGSSGTANTAASATCGRP